MVCGCWLSGGVSGLTAKGKNIKTDVKYWKHRDMLLYISNLFTTLQTISTNPRPFGLSGSYLRQHLTASTLFIMMISVPCKASRTVPGGSIWELLEYATLHTCWLD